MMVLVALESLHIRALHSPSAQSVSLRAATLEGAEHLLNRRHANNVELCMCPASYQGDSCQVGVSLFALCSQQTPHCTLASLYSSCK